MTQAQDYTAPEWPVRVSRKEGFGHVLELVEADEVTPDLSMTAGTFGAVVLDPSGIRIGQATCTRVAPNAVLVELTTVQMGRLRAGRYRLEVFYVSPAAEREDVVCILITLV